MAAVVLLLSVVVATAVVARESGDGEVVDLNEIQEDAGRNLLDENGRMLDPDQRLARPVKGFVITSLHPILQTLAHVARCCRRVLEPRT